MRRIEAAGDADHERLGARGGDPFRQSLDLDVERLVAIGVALLGGVGDEGEAPYVAHQPDIRQRRPVVETDAAEPLLRIACDPRGIVERPRPHSFLLDPFRIDIGDQQVAIAGEAPRFGDQFAQFMDHPLAVPGKIGRAFARSRGGIDIGADRARALRSGQHRTLARLADHDVGGGQVAADERPRQRTHRRRRGGGPVILADFGVEAEMLQIACGEDQVGAERDGLPG